jgi:hypothetical protein
MKRFSRVLATMSFAVAGLAMGVATPAVASTGVPLAGTSSDQGASFAGTLTWQDKNSFSATVKLTDVTCDDHPVYFLFVVTPGAGQHWEGKHRSNDEGCKKSIEWTGISATDNTGINVASIVVCTDLPSTTDACKTYEYPNPAAPPIKTP